MKEKNAYTLNEIMGDIAKNDPEQHQEIVKIIEKKRQAYIGRGGARENAGRKPKTGNILKFQVRVSEDEKAFLEYAREHKLNYKDLMQG